MTHTIGTCSLCGGRVVLHEHWMSVKAQIPHCESCGARVAQPHGPVIPMEQPAPKEIQERFAGTEWEPITRSAGWQHPQHPFKTPPVYDPLRTYRRS